eukprot:2543681-Ditylum_brightwellii.AAC.1
MKQKIATEATPLAHSGTVIFQGIMHERNISSHAASIQALGPCGNSDDENVIDGGSNYDIDDSAL